MMPAFGTRNSSRALGKVRKSRSREPLLPISVLRPFNTRCRRSLRPEQGGKAGPDFPAARGCCCLSGSTR